MIAVFAGRQHHTLKLFNVFQELDRKGLDPVWIVTRNSLNIDPPYEFIGGRFRHLHSYSGGSIQEVNAISNPLMKVAIDQKINRGIAPFWVAHSIREASESIVLLRRAMNDFDAAIILHENNFWGKILAYVCHEQDKPCFAFQEGVLRHSDQETLRKQSSAAEYSDILFTWTTDDLQAYIEAGVNQSKIRPVGPPHMDQWINLVSTEDREMFEEWTLDFYGRHGLVTAPIVFAPPLTGHYEGDFWGTLETLLENVKSLVVKPHPFEQADRIREVCNRYGAIFYDEVDPLPLFVASRVVLGQHSTTGLECGFLGKLYVQIDFDRVGISQPVIPAPTVYSPQDIKSVIDDGMRHLDNLYGWRKAQGADGEATKRAVNVIEGKVLNYQIERRRNE